MSRPVSQLGLFKVVLAVRWLIIVLLPVQVGLGRAGTHPVVVAGAIAAAVAYTLLLTLTSRRAMELHAAGLTLTVVDLCIALGLYATGPLTNWAFFLFSTTTVLFAGLRGKVWEGLAIGLVWNLLAYPVQLAWHLPSSQVFAIMGFEDIFNLTGLACVWAYSVGLVRKLNSAYDELAEGTDELAETNAHLDERERELLGLMDAGSALMRELELDAVLAIVVGALGDMGFGPCRIWVIEEDVLRAIHPPDQHVPDVSLSSGGPLAEALRRREPVSVSPQERESIAGFDPEMLAIAVPVMTDDEVLGVLALESLSGEPFDANEIDMLVLFADQVALAVQHVRFYELTQELAVAEERVRITREIHDTVVQKIYGANLLAEALCHEQVAPPISQRLRQLSDTILASLKDLRFAVLNWDSLEWREGLGGLVERYAAEYATLTGIGVSVVLNGRECDQHGPSARDVVQALQTALSNVRLHAQARSVQVELTCEGAGTRLVVRDNGRGFDVAEMRKKPAGGIAELRKRLRRHNGTVDVASAPGDGTQVSVWVPC